MQKEAHQTCGHHSHFETSRDLWACFAMFGPLRFLGISADGQGLLIPGLCSASSAWPIPVLLFEDYVPARRSKHCSTVFYSGICPAPNKCEIGLRHHTHGLPQVSLSACTHLVGDMNESACSHQPRKGLCFLKGRTQWETGHLAEDVGNSGSNFVGSRGIEPPEPPKRVFFCTAWSSFGKPGYCRGVFLAPLVRRWATPSTRNPTRGGIICPPKVAKRPPWGIGELSASY